MSGERDRFARFMGEFLLPLASRPMFTAEYMKYEWLMAHPEAINARDRKWLEEYCETYEWGVLYENEPG